MARRVELLPNGTLIGTERLTFPERPDGALGESLDKIAAALGCDDPTQLDAVLVVVPRGLGDELYRIVQQRLYGNNKRTEL